MEHKKAKRILVVDDEKDTVEMITVLLELEGYQVFAALSEVEAMKFLEMERRGDFRGRDTRRFDPSRSHAGGGRRKGYLP